MQPKDNRKKIIKRYETLTEEELALFEETYPNGYLRDVEILTKADGQTFSAVRMESETTVYLVKVEVPIQTILDSDEEDVEDEDPILGGQFNPFNDSNVELSESSDGYDG